MYELNPARAELLETFALDVAMVRGEGCILEDDEGRDHLDFLSQYGALPFGHNPQSIWAALNAARTEGLPSLVQPFRPVEAERLAARLAALAPGDLSIVTLANSGAEAVEAAIKLARVRTGRDLILSTRNGFHGKTLGALSATGKPVYQRDFAAPAPGFEHVAYGDLAALEARLKTDGDRIAAFIFEPIQGEGGVVVPPEGYVEGAIALCRRHGVLSIVDEIQTGLGRTGRLFACEDAPEAPDMLLLAKALGGGLMPIGACICRPEAWDDRFGRLHSSTFANNNLAARAANATLDLLTADDRALVRAVAENGRYLRDRLQLLQDRFPDVIREVRGRGYMTGLEFRRFDEGRSATMAFCSLNDGVTPLIASWLLNRRRVVTAPLFNESHVLRLQPPLVAGRAEIDRAMDALEEVCGILQRQDYAALVRHLPGARPRRMQAQDPRVQTQLAPSRPAPAEAHGPRRFAFLIHYTEEADVLRSDPSFASFSDQEMSDWLAWVRRLGPGTARRLPLVASRAGARAEGMILSVPMLPRDMRGPGRAQAVEMIRAAVDMAADAGADRVGLGAFTSIVTRGGESVAGRGAPVTSGNTLTTVTAVQAIERTAARAGLDLSQANVAVVGASGAIGRLAALMLARKAGSLTLVGNAGNPFAPKLLARVADEVCATLAATPAQSGGRLAAKMRRTGGLAAATGERFDKGVADRLSLAFLLRNEPRPLWTTTDIDQALRQADVVLVATSSDATLVDPSALRPGTLVCDVARPPNVAHADLAGRGVLAFDGGLARPPFEIDLGPFQTLPKNLCWGCLGETMLLALAGEERDYSLGSQLSLADADRIAELAALHGFEPAPTQWYGEMATEADLDAFAAHVQVPLRRTAFQAAG